MAYPMPVIPAVDWNRVGEQLKRKLCVRISGRRDRGGFRHPWHTRVRHNFETAKWEANVRAGFVNGLETEAPAVPFALAPERTRERLSAAAGQVVNPWISEDPWFELPKQSWRSIGTDADASRDPEGVPEFFQALGVGGPPRIDIEPDLSGITVVFDPLLDADQRRLLRALDLVLYVPKPAVKLATVEDGTGVEVDVSLALPAPDAVSWIAASRFFRETAPALSIQEQLATGQTDTTFLEWKLVTIYLLSPPGQAEGSEPDGSWIPFGRQYLHWNRVLAYRTNLESLPRLNLTLTTGLAGGLADPIFNALLEPVNEADALASLALSQASVKVEWWDL